jgi:membrane-associated phospholipid phosphatase
VPTSHSINTTWYLELNRLARESSWAHGAMRFYSHDFGAALLAVVLLAAWWRARAAERPERAVAGVLWAAGGTVGAWVVAHVVLKPVVREPRPYLVLHHVEVLLGRTHGFSFPSGHATVAGAVIVGLWLGRRFVAAVAATLLGLLLAFGRVYTGMHYPFDVVGGLVFGGAFVAVLWPVALPLIASFDRVLLRSRFAPLVATSGGAGRRAAPVGAGLGAAPLPIATEGALASTTEGVAPSATEGGPASGGESEARAPTT